jgi:glutamate dehydrogenase (NAD(P)+)
MGRRYDENSNINIMNMVESTTGVTLTPEQRAMIAKGATELEIVNSGLEDTMVRSYHEIREIKMSNKKIGSLRTAAFIGAVDKIAVSYMNMGIWP